MQTKIALASLALGLAFTWTATSEAARSKNHVGLSLEAALAELNSNARPRQIDRQLVRHWGRGYGHHGGRYRTWSHYSPSYGRGYGHGYRGQYCPPRHRGYYVAPYPSRYFHHHYPAHVHGGIGIHGPNGAIHIRF